MKIKAFFPLSSLTVLLAFVLTANSCSKDDGYSLNDYWVGIGTIQTEGMQDGYYIEMDNGDKLFPSVQNFYYKPVDGQRAIINYTILYDEQEFYDHLVRMNYISNILTKGTIDLTSANQDSIGNDKVQIEDFWVSNGYLNIIFGYNASGTDVKHFINLVNNTIVDKPDDGRVHLELRHNANNDAAIYGFRSIVSFNILNLFPENAQNGELVFIANTFYEGKKQYTISIDLSGDVPSFLSISQQKLENIALEHKQEKY